MTTPDSARGHRIALVDGIEFPKAAPGISNVRQFMLKVRRLELAAGKAVGVLGISGSGKTTLFDILAGVNRTEVRDVIRCTFPKVAYLMHRSALLPWLNVHQNFVVEQKLRREGGNFDRFERFLLTLDLNREVLDKKCLHLSFGMLQRVELAMALSFEVNFLILDEGLSGLNAALKLAAVSLIRRHIVERQMACIFTSHFSTDVLRLADSVVQIEEGVLGEEYVFNTPASARQGVSDIELLTMPECSEVLRRYEGRDPKACDTFGTLE